MRRSALARVLPPAVLLALPAAEAVAWPVSVMEAMARDARRLIPRSLAALIAEREPQILEEAARFPPELSRLLAADLAAGTLQPETLAAFDAHTATAVVLLRQRRVSEGIVRLGATFRVPADLSDPVLTVGPQGYPPGVVREYYQFVEVSLEKIPVVLDDERALRLERRGLHAYWQRLYDRSRAQSPVILTELFQNGRVVSHRAIDSRSPVFGVASLSYSRAVTAIAATWLTLWREARGDLTRMPTPTDVRPSERPPTAARAPQSQQPSPEAE